MFINYRVYLSAIAQIIVQILDANGIGQYTGESVLTAVEIFIALLTILFRFYVGRKLFTPKSIGGTP